MLYDVYMNDSDSPEHLHRREDPETSRDAARSGQGFRRTQKTMMMMAHGMAVHEDPDKYISEGLIADEAWIRAGGEIPTLSCYWHRHGDLFRDGYLERLDVKRPGMANKEQFAFRLTQKGYDHYQRIRRIAKKGA